MISANTQVLAIVAGVFFFLPSFAMALFAPMPEPTTSLDETQALNMMSAYYSHAAPWLVTVGIAQAIGILALLALLTDRRRPTVGEALKAGSASLLPYIAAQLLLGVVIGLGFIAIIAAAAAFGSVAVAAALIPFGFAGLVYVITKTSLAAPVIVIDGLRNPVRALARSWALTKGNSLRLFGFYFLVFLALIVIMIVISMIVGLLSMVALGGGVVSQIANGILSGLAGSLAVVYFVAIIASAHRQLSGPSPEAISETFE
jgi:hypothetical protein